MSNSTMKGSAGVIILVVCLLAISGMLAYIFLIKPATPVGNSPASLAQVSPTVPIKNFAPSLSASQTTSILIQTDDSSDEKYIVPTKQVSVYVKSLPQGDHVISETAL